jgi:hypothetical protein
MWTPASIWPRTALLSAASTVQRASDLLKEINLIYGVVSGIMLKYAFEWATERDTYNKTHSWLAVGLALGSLAFAGVLVTLMAGVAMESVTTHGTVEPTLVVFFMVFLVVVALTVISVVALVTAVAHLVTVLRH